ncbi:hypothetical protein BGZ47_001353 [Haplosporangium gracile]|nr:hypothetical protein BGZ47_001353 [Haplosporangium gracile]
MWEKLMNKGEKLLLDMTLAHLSFPTVATAEDDAEVEVVKNPIAPMGSWHGSLIVIIGDYSEGFPPFFTSQDQQDYNAFYAAKAVKLAEENEQLDNLEDQRKAQFPKQRATHRLILNPDKKKYLDPVICRSPSQAHEEGNGTAVATYVGAFAHQKDGIMQGLFSLLFYSNGSGGGDVDKFKKGRWAGNRISIQVKESVEDLAEWKISAEVEADLNFYLRNDQ